MKINLNNLILIASVTSIFTMTTLFFAPGFLHDDSGWMLNQAINLTINDWHPPLLIWLWGKLFSPSVFGPLFPFLVQNLVFWIGVYLISFSVLQKKKALGLLLPFIFLILPQTFIVYWISTDGSFVAISTLALGIVSISVTSKFKPILFLTGISIASLTFISRPYLWIIVGALLFIYFTLNPLPKLKRASRMAAVAIIVVPLFAVLFTSSVVRPADAHPESGPLLIDLMAMECQGREIYNKVPQDGLLPRIFLLNNVEDFCTDFSMNTSLMGYFVNPADKTQTKIRWIQNSEETRIAIFAWVRGFIENPSGLMKRKIVNFIGSNRPGLYGSSLLPNPNWSNLESTSIGLGAQSGFPVKLGSLALRYIKLQASFNSSWFGKLLQSSVFLLSLGLLVQIIRRKKSSFLNFLIILTPFFACVFFFFFTGMTTDGSRYYQSLNLVLVCLVVICSTLVQKNSLHSKHSWNLFMLSAKSSFKRLKREEQ
jgi:hypothetical protein